MRHEAHATPHELIGPEIRDVLVTQQHGAGVDVHEAKDRLQQGGLSRPIGPDDANEFSIFGIQIRAVEDVYPGEVARIQAVCPHQRSDRLRLVHLLHRRRVGRGELLGVRVEFGLENVRVVRVVWPGEIGWLGVVHALSPSEDSVRDFPVSVNCASWWAPR